MVLGRVPNKIESPAGNAIPLVQSDQGKVPASAYADCLWQYLWGSVFSLTGSELAFGAPACPSGPQEPALAQGEGWKSAKGSFSAPWGPVLSLTGGNKDTASQILSEASVSRDVPPPPRVPPVSP